MSDLFKEFPEHNRAVVLNAEGETLWQLVKPVITKRGRWSTVEDVLAFPTKKEAQKRARLMGMPLNHVEQIKAPMGFMPWAIRYDFRSDYYIACWEM